jgi:hypothetical protein
MDVDLRKEHEADRLVLDPWDRGRRQHGEEVRSMEPLYREIGRTVRYAIAKRDRTACLCALMVVGAAIYALLLFIG